MTKLSVWFHVHVSAALGTEAGPEVGPPTPVGPVLEHIDLKRGPDGSFKISRSFEFITHGGTKVDPKTAEVEAIAMEWDDGG